MTKYTFSLRYKIAKAASYLYGNPTNPKTFLIILLLLKDTKISQISLFHLKIFFNHLEFIYFGSPSTKTVKTFEEFIIEKTLKEPLNLERMERIFSL